MAHSVGLINQQTQSWDSVMNFKQNGKFKMYAVINKPGIYTPTIANNLRGFGWNSVQITKMGWGTTG